MATLWERLRGYCLAFEGAVEEYPWNSVVYKVRERGKVFAITGGEGTAIPVTAKPRPESRELFLSLPGVSVARYVGRFGWVTVLVQDEESLELARDLIAESYALKSGNRRPVG